MNNLKARLENLKEKLNFAEKKRRISLLEEQTKDSELWKDWKKGQKIASELASLKKEVEEIEEVEELIESLQTQKAQNREKGAKEVERILEKLELKVYLGGAHDKNNALLSIHAGAGGTEAMDWTSMLARMYNRFVKNKGWKAEVLDQTPGEEAGLKSTTFEINGNYAYGYLKGEAGVHRLVRQSPFNADHLRQTSFALVEVIPLIEKDIKVEIEPKDLEVWTFRASAPGGQHMQKTESAVRLKHKPTGITVSCQAERSQFQNKKRALRVLQSKLYEVGEKDKKLKTKKLKGEYKVPEWGNQIRSYVLHPYKMVKDLRTKAESANPEAVLDGALDKFIEAELRWKGGVV